MRLMIMAAVLGGWLGGGRVALAAQAAPARTGPLPDMNAIAKALGVSCSHCHVQGDFASDANPKKGVARQMLAMTRDINARVAAAAGKPATAAVAVQCATCHRGQPVPRSLTETLIAAIGADGNAAGAERYRDLRTRYYGRDTFDFSEQEFLSFCFRLAESRPDAAIPILNVHLEFTPRSADAYVALSRAYVVKRDRPSAIAALKKALEIEPAHGLAQGYLAQLDTGR
ncbi:MAG: c-type cytochrome [Vicinamibacterales bacterium]